MTQFPIRIRDAASRDLGFVLGYWLESLWCGAPHTEALSAWKRRVRPHVADLIGRGVCVVAEDPEAADVLFGFACGAPGALHYAFVRQTRRRAGVGTALLHELLARGVVPERLTYTTRDGERWWAASAKRAA